MHQGGTPPGLTVPSMSFEGEMSLWFGTREVRLMCLGRGHSGGIRSLGCPIAAERDRELWQTLRG
jgi:hypothetical protein